MLSECRHRGFVYGLDYCPECGETDISKLLHERYIHELKDRIALLEAEIRFHRDNFSGRTPSARNERLYAVLQEDKP
jgi:hypothetical protein